MAIQWAEETWKKVKGTTIKNRFERCGLVKSNEDLTEVEGDDLEFEVLAQELSHNMSAAEYDIPTSEPMINDNEVSW